MQRLLVLIVLFQCFCFSARGGDLAFRPAGGGYYAFDTGLLRGKMRLDGQAQGISSMVYVPDNQEVTASVGLLSYYRMFSTGKRYGEAIRDWAVVAKLLEGGDMEIRFPPATDHPMEIVGRFHWRSPDTLDLETTVKAAGSLPHLEVFLSSYFSEGFDASVYVKPNRHDSGQREGFLPVDSCPLLDGDYLVFPLIPEMLPVIFDGRWEMGPKPVGMAFTRCLAAPLAVRRHESTGLTAVLMSRPKDCFAVSASYNKRPPDGVAAHRSLYLSLFGNDLAASKAAQSHCRLIVTKGLSNETILKRYVQYLAERTD